MTSARHVLSSVTCKIYVTLQKPLDNRDSLESAESPDTNTQVR